VWLKMSRHFSVHSFAYGTQIMPPKWHFFRHVDKSVSYTISNSVSCLQGVKVVNESQPGPHGSWQEKSLGQGQGSGVWVKLEWVRMGGGRGLERERERERACWFSSLQVFYMWKLEGSVMSYCHTQSLSYDQKLVTRKPKGYAKYCY
jgi:hypothetical protein